MARFVRVAEILFTYTAANQSPFVIAEHFIPQGMPAFFPTGTYVPASTVMFPSLFPGLSVDVAYWVVLKDMTGRDVYANILDQVEDVSSPTSPTVFMVQCTWRTSVDGAFHFLIQILMADVRTGTQNLPVPGGTARLIPMPILLLRRAIALTRL